MGLSIDDDKVREDKAPLNHSDFKENAEMKKPFPVKSRRQEKASDAVISRRVGFALVQHDSAIVRTSSDCARCLGRFLSLTFPLAVDLRFVNHQFIILLIIGDLIQEGNSVSLFNLGHVHPQINQGVNEHHVMCGTC